MNSLSFVGEPFQIMWKPIDVLQILGYFELFYYKMVVLLIKDTW